MIATDCDGRVVRMNATAERLTGWAAAAAAGMLVDNVFEVVNEQTRQSLDGVVTRALNEQRVVDLAPNTILVSRDGMEHPVQSGAAPVLDAAGQLRGAVLVFRDNRAQRAAREALRRSESKYRELYEHSPDLYASVDLESERIIECNLTLARSLGYPKEELIGRSILDVHQGVGTAQSLAALRTSFQSGEEVHGFETALRRRDGTAIDVNLSMHCFRDEHGRATARIAWNDVTALRRVEREVGKHLGARCVFSYCARAV